MVLFISQSDNRKQQSCLTIKNLENSETKEILKWNRVALYIEVPCSEFVYNMKDNVFTDFSITNDKTGQTNSHKIYRYMFDNRNILYSFDENDMKYRQVNPFDINRELQRVQDQNNFDGIRSNTCRKNEQDDYMIGLLLLLIQKTSKECFKFIVDYKPIVFTNDKYEWMKTSLKEHCIFEKDFFSYLKNDKKHDMKSINPKKYKFWYGSKETSKKEEQTINDISKELYINVY